MADARSSVSGVGAATHRDARLEVPRSPAPSGSTGRRRGPWFSSRRRQRLIELCLLLPAVVFLLLFFGFPVVKNVLMGFQSYTTRTFFTGEAPWVGLANYSTVLHSAVFSKAMLNTVL